MSQIATNPGYSASSMYPAAGLGYPANANGSIINSPKIDTSGKPTQRSVTDADMAANIIKTLVMAGRNRSIVNSRILAKYNAERPYDAYKLEAEGLNWRSNFTTKPLPAMIEKVAPRFVQAVDGLKYFTNSTLSNKWSNSVEKSDYFRRVITETIRGRRGFKTLIEDIAFNNGIFGHTITSTLSNYTWFPRNFQQDESFVADGTKSDSRWAQIVCLKETLLPHELFEHISGGEDVAKAAGWNLENARIAINRAAPSQIRDRLNVGGTLETWYQNALRELTIGASYMAGHSVVVIYNLLAREVTGKVSHYRLAGPEMLPIFEKEDAYESMPDIVSFYTFQKGNGTLHGSKGVGRDIYELAGMLDRSRNEVVDRLIMSGKIVVQGDVKRIHTFKMSVIGGIVIMPNGWTFPDQKFDGDVEPFLKLDAYFSGLVDRLIGAVSPPNVEGMGEALRSPQAWALIQQREEESRDVRITRFLEQFVDMVGTMQKRICDPDTRDEDAKEAQKKLLEKMTREEVTELASQMPASSVKELTPIEKQLRVAICAEKRGNPLYNQRQLEIEDLNSRADNEFADRVLLPENDPTEEAEQNRQQQMEIVLLSGGTPVPVSPRDAHIIHMKVLFPILQQMAQHISEGKFTTDVLEVAAAHLNEHFNRALQQGTKKEQLADIANFLKQLPKALEQLKQLDAQAQQVQAQSQQLEAQHAQDGSGNGVIPNPSPLPPPQ